MIFKHAREGENQWWMYILTTLLMFIGYGVGQLPLLWAQTRAVDKYALGTDDINTFLQTMDFSILHLTTNQGIFLMFFIFVVATIFFLLGIKFIHKKSIQGLITPRSRINWPKVAFGFVVWIVLTFIFELINYLINPDNYELIVNWGRLFWLFIICITVLPIQTTLEELFFRSYLMKGIGLLSKYKWIPLVITSLLFGLVHGTNPEMAKFGAIPMQLYYISAGLILGIMTIMDDGLELAIGVHAATNFYGAIFFCFEGSVLQTDSIWRITEVNAWAMAGVFILSGVIFLWLAQRMFDWRPFTKILDPITFEDSNV